MLYEVITETDLLMRALRIQEKSQKILDSASPEIVASLKAFADGVNQYMMFNPLPTEFQILSYHPEFWEPVHSINLIGYRITSYNVCYTKLLRLQPHTFLTANMNW